MALSWPTWRQNGRQDEPSWSPKVVFFLVFYNVFCIMVVPTSTCFQVGQLGAKMGFRWPTWSAKLTNLAPRCLQDRRFPSSAAPAGVGRAETWCQFAGLEGPGSPPRALMFCRGSHLPTVRQSLFRLKLAILGQLCPS